MKKGKLIVLSGFSGSGKGTVVNELLNKYDDYAISVSATTRKPREGEIEGVHYFFKTVEEFEEMIDRDEFIENAVFVNNHYGTPKEFVEKKLDEGINVILEIEVVGALNIKKKLPDTLMVYIIPPTAYELKRRLVSRGTETEDVVNNRLKRAVEEIDFIKSYDYVIINDELNECVEKINEIIHSEEYNKDNNLNAFLDRFKDELKDITEGE